MVYGIAGVKNTHSYSSSMSKVQDVLSTGEVQRKFGGKKQSANWSVIKTMNFAPTPVCVEWMAAHHDRQMTPIT